MDNICFKVNTRQLPSNHRDKFMNIIDGPVKKYGYKIPGAVVKKMNLRQV